MFYVLFQCGCGGGTGAASGDGGSVGVCVRVYIQEVRSPQIVTGGCEPPGLLSRNWTQLFWKSHPWAHTPQFLLTLSSVDFHSDPAIGKNFLKTWSFPICTQMTTSATEHAQSLFYTAL